MNKIKKASKSHHLQNETILAPTLLKGSIAIIQNYY